jgi:hypothetical protein
MSPYRPCKSQFGRVLLTFFKHIPPRHTLPWTCTDLAYYCRDSISYLSMLWDPPIFWPQVNQE